MILAGFWALADF